ncbi:MAG: metallophosphoesterase [Mediterranea sp.]|nr:metallophosphoesterase [Mediterranea sp.]
MMHPVPLAILLLFLWLPDIYIYRYYVRPQTRSLLLRLLHFLPSVLLSIALAVLLYKLNANTLAHHARVIGVLSVCLLAGILPKLLFTLLTLLFFPVRKLLHLRRKPFTVTAFVLAVVSLSSIAYGATFGVNHIVVKPLEYARADVPAGFDGYRIVQLSDIHIGSRAGDLRFVQRMVERVNKLKPDLILFTGDLVNQRSRELDAFTDELSRLHATDGVYSVLGNHDYGTYYRWRSEEEQMENFTGLLQRQAQMHWTLLNNSHVVLHHRGDSIALIGVENDGEPPFGQHADLPRATANTAGMFGILMTHNPTHWLREVVPDTDIRLTLSGHTHAMQLVLFGHSPAEWMYPQWRGLYTHDGQDLYVNTGIGYIGLPFRLGANPEITLITLKHIP